MKVVLPWLLLIGINLAGCSATSMESQNTNLLSTNAYGMTLQSSLSVCCQALSEIQYIDLPTAAEFSFEISSTSSVFNFKEGKSYFSAYKLPLNKGNMKITISSSMDKKVFVPTVLLLDGNFQITRILDSSVFKFEKAKLLNGDEITGSFAID